MTDSLARRAVRAFGDLPAAQTGLSVDRALELAGVDATEFALLASTTFKEAQSLEELVTVIAATRRRGLDGLSRHVYYERFGGQSSDPSMHTGIDGLRAIAAATGRYGGSSEPRFSDIWDMPTDDKGTTKPVPAKCTMTVYAIVQGRSCAFEGVAWMDEAYPGTSLRGRMWRLRPRGMLSIAAERQALRKAFPNETNEIDDVDDAGEPEALPPPPPAPTRTIAENAALHDRIYASDDEPAPRKRERPLEDLVEHYGQRVQQAIDDGLLGEAEIDEWILPADATRKVVIQYGTKLQEDVFSAQAAPAPERSDAAAELTARTPSPDVQPSDAPLTATLRNEPVSGRSVLGQKLATLIEEAARLEVDFDDCALGMPAPKEQVIRACERLEERIQRKKDRLAGLSDPSQTQQGVLHV